ncbi:MAG: aminotransferase class V-fold PLP-dependent enzyme, partial [Actinomycetota bacterium]|nr:aminotransferase class V-fold PLP-dependent enzyme [Actinomycetota bacterium]
IDRDDFPTDRYLVESIAAERGATVRWINEGDVTPERVAEVVGPRTAVVVLSAIAYRSGFLADLPAITGLVHEGGALMLWDLCHSAGVLPHQLDAWGVDFAVGCSYKYLNGGPGSPAFAYVRAGLQAAFRQPITGWLGSASPFEMQQGYQPGPGMRRVLSGTPPVLGMVGLQDSIALVEEAGIDAIRAKSIALTERAIALADELLPDAVLATPRDADRRGSHITLDHPAFEAITPRLWARGVIPDFRRPTGIRLGLSPLSTSFAELELGVRAIAEELAAQ